MPMRSDFDRRGVSCVLPVRGTALCLFTISPRHSTLGYNRLGGALLHSEGSARKTEAGSGVAIVGLSRPEKKNVLSIALIHELVASIEALSINNSLHCIVSQSKIRWCLPNGDD